mgnify:CR=1 FL=1
MLDSPLLGTAGGRAVKARVFLLVGSSSHPWDIGAAYGIRTHDSQDENLVSKTARRTQQNSS